MNAKVSEFLSEHVPRFTKALETFDRKVNPQAPPDCDATVDELTQCINDSLAVCSQLDAQIRYDDPLLLKDVQARYRAAIWPWFGKSWFMQRALDKPRGYPGDYVLLSAIYEGFAKSPGLGGYLDRYFLNTTLGRAVPARMWAARRFLMDELASRQGRVGVLNVACGACREYLGGFEPALDRETTITCVDNDPEALEFARSLVGPPLAKSGIAANFVRYNALRMTSSETTVRRFGRSDIIYSVGLCDYIPDEFLIPLLKGWRESLREGGVVYVAFKDTMLYDKTEYQWLTDWYFFQRTEEEFEQLFVQAGYDLRNMEVSRDATGVIINFLCRTQAGSTVRIDEPQQRRISQHVDSLKPQPDHVRQ